MTFEERVTARMRAHQDAICNALTAIDPKGFEEDQWERSGGGGGWTRVLQEGLVFEKAGVNTSAVHGVLPEEARASMRDRTGEEASNFFATGISLVIHPRNPHCPTVHANYRYFALDGGHEPGSWWFGGGADLTPSYLYEEDAVHFHAVHRAACDAHDASYYPRFKRWCDDYFHIRHRGERRGIGGIFFDRLDDKPRDDLLAFVDDCANAFPDAFVPIAERRQDMPFDEEQRRWQQLRRGRYVEFNLVWDRGTTFGLRTQARVESVLMSLPLTARWEYANEPSPGSPEADLLDVLRFPRDWLDT